MLNVNVRKSLSATKEKLSKPFRSSTIEETAALAAEEISANAVNAEQELESKEPAQIDSSVEDDGICLSEDASTDDTAVESTSEKESGDEGDKTSPRG